MEQIQLVFQAIHNGFRKVVAIAHPCAVVSGFPKTGSGRTICPVRGKGGHHQGSFRALKRQVPGKLFGGLEGFRPDVEAFFISLRPGQPGISGGCVFSGQPEQGGVEVDFILYGENDIYAIEVKNSDKVRSDDLRSLNEFKKDYPNCRTILLYNGNEKLLINDTICIPCELFLSNLIPDSPLPIN